MYQPVASSFSRAWRRKGRNRSQPAADQPAAPTITAAAHSQLGFRAPDAMTRRA